MSEKMPGEKRKKKTGKSLEDLDQQLKDAGITLQETPTDPAAAEAAPAGVSADEKTTPEEIRAPEAAEPREELPKQADRSEEPAEWQVLVAAKPHGDGKFHGRKYWKAPDGSGYIQGDAGLPIHVVHGAETPRYDLKGLRYRSKAFWDGTKGTFVLKDPTPERREARKAERERLKNEHAQQQSADTLQQSSDETARSHEAVTVFSGDQRRDLQSQLARAMEDYEISDAARVELIRGIGGVDTAEKEAEFMALLERFPGKTKAAENESGPRISNESELEDLLGKLKKKHEATSSDDKASKSKPNPKKRTKAKAAEKEDTQEQETEEQKREKILNALDPKQFTPHEVHAANWTGGEGRGTENTYTHPDAPGMIFTETERSAGERAKRESIVRETARKDAEATPGRTARNIERAETGKKPENDLNYRTAAYRGIEPKYIDALINGPDALGFSMLIESLDETMGKEIKRKTQSEIMLSVEEMRLADFARYEYTRRLKQVEFLHTQLNTVDLEVAGRINPDFASLLAFRGPARTLEVFKKMTLEMAMKNREGFEVLLRAYEDLTHLRDTGTYQKWEKGVQDLCARRGVSMGHYDEAFQTGTQEQRVATRREIQEKIRHGLTPFWRTIDQVTGSSFRRADRMVRKADGLAGEVRSDETVRGVHDAMNSLTTVLKFTLVDNPEARLLIQQEAVRNENLMTSADSGPRTFAEAKTAETKSTSEMRTEFEKVAKEFKTANGRDWDHATKEERTEALKPLRQAQRERDRQSGQGWFASAFAAIANAAFGIEESKLINKPTLK